MSASRSYLWATIMHICNNAVGEYILQWRICLIVTLTIKLSSLKYYSENCVRGYFLTEFKTVKAEWE